MILIEELKEKYGAEMTTVILACRVYFKTAGHNELQQFIDDNTIDWEKLTRICTDQDIRPIVYRILADIDLPEPVASTIKHNSYALIRQNWKQAVELERIIKLLDENGIAAVPYKGIAFSKQFYGDLVSRESIDMDLIVEPGCLADIIPLMESEGYVFEAGGVYKNLGSRYLKYFKELSCKRFKNGGQEFFFEFHWRIAEDFMMVNPQSNKLLHEVDTRITIHQARVNALNPNAHFLAVLIHHSTKDVFNTLKKIIDISQIAHQKEFIADWDYLFNNINALGLNKAISVSNSLSQQLFGVTITNKAANITQKDSLRFINLTLSEKMANTRIYNIAAHISRVKLKDTVTEKAKYISGIARLAFTPAYADFEVIRLPPSLFGLYFLTKPFRIVFKLFKGK
jgi:hypothetical protein